MLGDCTDGDVVELATGDLASVSWHEPLEAPYRWVFVRLLDPIDGTRTDPRPMPASTEVAEMVEAAPVRAAGPEPSKVDAYDPVLSRGRQGALL
jgi:hypothetical protein